MPPTLRGPISGRRQDHRPNRQDGIKTAPSSCIATTSHKRLTRLTRSFPRHEDHRGCSADTLWKRRDTFVKERNARQGTRRLRRPAARPAGDRPCHAPQGRAPHRREARSGRRRPAAARLRRRDELAHRARHDDGYDARGVRLVQPDPRGDRRAVSGRRVERPERAERGGRRPRRHPLELRRAQRHGRRRAADGGADDRLGVDVRAARRTRRLHLALRPGGSLLALRLRPREPELPARRAAGGRERKGRVHHDLPRLLCRPLAAHPLRGLPQPLRGDERREQGRDVADRAAQGDLRRRLRARAATRRA